MSLLSRCFYSDFLYFIDIFKKPLYLNINTKPKYSTCLGSFFSLLLIPVIVFQFFQSPLYLKTNPNVIDQIRRLSYSPLVHLTNDNFKFYVGLTNAVSQAYAYDPKVFKVELIVGSVVVNQTANVPETQVTVSKFRYCTELAENQTNFDFSQLTNYLCPEDSAFDLKASE